MGTSKISLSLAASRKPTAGVKRSHAALRDEEDDGRVQPGRVERVSHFDQTAGGAIDETAKKPDTAPLVIPKQANRDWKEAATQRRRQKSELPGAHGREDTGTTLKQNGSISTREEGRKEKELPKFGLNVLSKAEGSKTHESVQNGETSARATERHTASPESDKDTAPRQKTDDELAMDAILGKSTTTDTLVLPAQPSLSEADAFRHDFADAPDMSTLDEYARVPVEQFGAALLRGMGWKEGEGIGSQRGKKMDPKASKVPERRAALLGIGAKEDKTVAREMGAWGKAAKGGKEVKIYNPVLLRDKRTGEMFTEDELQKRKEQEEREKYEMEFDRKERGREKKRRRDEDDSRVRNGSRRQDSDHRGDRHDRERDRRKDEQESDEQYYRRKEKERRRRREREERYGSDHDHDHSRKHREHTERYADGYDGESSRRREGRTDNERHRGKDRDRDRDRRK